MPVPPRALSRAERLLLIQALRPNSALDVHATRRAAVGPSRHSRRAPAPPGRARSVGEHGRLDRYLPRGPEPDARRHFVFLTDSAVGSKEEDNLRHLVINLGSDVPRSKVVPFLTCKHTMDYCLAYADRAQQHGFSHSSSSAATRTSGIRDAWSMRGSCVRPSGAISLAAPRRLGESACRRVTQVESPAGRPRTAEFYLTQIVSHHSRPEVEALLERSGAPRPDDSRHVRRVLLSVGEPEDTQALRGFLPVPAEELTAEFGDGAHRGGDLRPVDPRA